MYTKKILACPMEVGVSLSCLIHLYYECAIIHQCWSSVLPRSYDFTGMPVLVNMVADFLGRHAFENILKFTIFLVHIIISDFVYLSSYCKKRLSFCYVAYVTYVNHMKLISTGILILFTIRIIEIEHVVGTNMSDGSGTTYMVIWVDV